VRQIDAKLDDQQGYQDDIATMQSIQKSNKAFKKTIDHYLDLMLVEQRLSDIDKMDILELMNDLKVQKEAFKANIKNTEEINKIKTENQEMSFVIGQTCMRKALWKPNALNKTLLREKRAIRKAPLVKFNIDGKLIES